MENDGTVDWLLKGDVAIQYQTKRDLLTDENTLLQDRISQEGWGLECEIQTCRSISF